MLDDIGPTAPDLRTVALPPPVIGGVPAVCDPPGPRAMRTSGLLVGLRLVAISMSPIPCDCAARTLTTPHPP